MRGQGQGVKDLKMTRVIILNANDGDNKWLWGSELDGGDAITRVMKKVNQDHRPYPSHMYLMSLVLYTTLHFAYGRLGLRIR